MFLIYFESCLFLLLEDTRTSRPDPVGDFLLLCFLQQQLFLEAANAMGLAAC